MKPGDPISQFAEANPTLFFIIVIILTAWSLYWKGMALWKASKLDKQNWFIALLIINTLGIFEILYLYVFSKKHEEQKQIGV